MIYVLLAGALGAITIISVLLLFRRLRYLEKGLDRQLTAICAERDSEWILREISRVPNETTEQANGAARTVNGAEVPPPPPLPGLIRTKGGLHLLRGGLGSAAVLALTGGLRQMWRSHPARLATATATAVAVTVAALFMAAPWDTGDDNRRQHAVPTEQPPTVLPTSSHRPTPSASASPSPTLPGLLPNLAPSPAPPAGSETTAAAIAPDGIMGPGPSSIPAPSVTPPGPTPAPSTPPGRTRSPSPTESPPGRTRRPSPPPRPGLCADVTLPPLVAIDVCLGGG